MDGNAYVTWVGCPRKPGRQLATLSPRRRTRASGAAVPKAHSPVLRRLSCRDTRSDEGGTSAQRGRGEGCHSSGTGCARTDPSTRQGPVGRFALDSSSRDEVSTVDGVGKFEVTPRRVAKISTTVGVGCFGGKACGGITPTGRKGSRLPDSAVPDRFL